VLEAPTRIRPRLLPAEVVGALAGLYAAYQGLSYYDPGAADLISIGVAALAAPVLALPRPARLRPLAIIGFGAFVVAFLALADLGDTGTHALIAGLVMLAAGGFALYQRTVQP
jgi:peptidoglycan/LPS O-acetylase OafA/YrhL